MTDVSSKGPEPSDERKVLTNRQGHPVYDNQNQRTVGARGPATLENYQFLEKISHFDRERVPERVVHARGVTAYGYFESYGAWGEEPIARHTRAKLFQERGKRTDVAVRFSTVIGGRDSAETTRDPRGFAVKFYTEEGNWDLVGNNLGVFFIRDAIKFPDVIHALKPDPVSHEQKPARIFDFMSQTPESMHMLVNLFSPRGIPADYRHMQGFGVNTYKWVNEQGETKLVKYHWMPKQGVRSMTEADAAAIQANELGHATKDLYEAIRRGDHPEWELLVQMMDDHEHPELHFDPLDDTKTWPEQEFPPRPVGRMVLDRTVDNYFAENEQIAFGTGVLVDGLDFSDDKMLVGRTFSYSDTQRYRVGANYLQLPVNAAKGAAVRTNQRDGQMAIGVDDSGANPEVNYEPSITGGLREAEYRTTDDQGPEIHGRVTRKRIPRTNDYQQAGQRYLLMEQWERDDLVHNMVTLLSQCDRPVQERMVWHFLLVENELGLRVGEGLGIPADAVRRLPPLASQTLTEEDERRLARLGDNPPRDVAGLTMTHCVPDERHVVSR
ncbi:catalase [Streptomyces johnsoniae]|uniref:catalase n=1 Tax=Streptomyces johnsoniae TaxID=3075532 RepID=A0ABU2S3C8_9ACTN|nr:catalase [Streptomyces sp. DSM 41886]MDT0443498.1 catalase [Streptomyces sp. DSM 41886]